MTFSPRILRSVGTMISIALLSSACTIQLGGGRSLDDDTTSWDQSGWVVDDDGTDPWGGEDPVTPPATDPGASPGEDPAEDPSSLVCTPWEGSAQTDDACDALPIAPHNDATCNGDFSFGYMVCLRGYEIYNAGQMDELVSCMGELTDPCDDAGASACVEQMYANACTFDVVSEVCGEVATVCDGAGETFDRAQCEADLNPFNDDGLDEVLDCMNAETGTCQDRYDTCLESALSA